MKTTTLRGATDELYRSIFQHSAVSLWVQDIADLRRKIAEWRSAGISELRSYLPAHPSALREAVHAISVVDVNDATLEMYEVEKKEALLGPLDKTLDLDNPVIVESILSDIVMIAEGRTTRESLSAAVTPSGKKIDIDIKVYIPPESSPQPYMLVSVLNVTDRMRLEREIEEERRLYHTLIDNLPDSVYVKDVEGRFLLANRALGELMEVDDPGKLVGNTDFDFYPAELANRFSADEQGVLREGRELINEREDRGPGGGPRWTLSTKVPVRDANGTIYGLVGITKDITKPKAVEDALSSSELRYRRIFDNAPVGIFHTTAEGKLLDANPAFAQILGFDSPEELIDTVNRHNIAAIYQDPERRSLVVERLLASPIWQRFQEPLRRRDGSTATGRMMLRSYLPAGAEAPGLECFVEDISDQEAAREALARERSLLKALMDNVPDRIFFKNRRGAFTLVNMSQARALGSDDPESVIGKGDADYLPREYAEASAEREGEIIATGRPLFEREERIRPSGKGRETWLSTTRMALRDDSGAIVGTFGISRDITSQKELQDQLIRAQRLESLGQLAAGIAHQFNNLNAVVLGNIEIAVSHEELPSGLRSYLESAIEGVRRAVEITQRLEVLSEGSRASASILALDETVRELLRRFEGRMQAEGVTLKTELAYTGTIRSTRATIDFLVTSLLSNALHALIGRNEPEITVRTRASSGMACLEVSDNGSGIRREDLPKVFTPFFTTKGEWAPSGSPQSQAKGVGLSLAVCRSLVTECGGRMELASSEEFGTTISACFPSEEGPAARAPR
ncbi:MAG TPA: PAS domain S-box protein [Spirochaetia bacterium]|nr:PAS domain S-box protein [Spirochaetia bacterium]